MLFPYLLLGVLHRQFPLAAAGITSSNPPQARRTGIPRSVVAFPFLIRTEETRADSLQETQVLNSSNKLLKTPNRCSCVFPAPYAGCVEAPADLQKSRCMSHTCFNIKAQVIGKWFITTLSPCILSSVPQEYKISLVHNGNVDWPGWSQSGGSKIPPETGNCTCPSVFPAPAMTHENVDWVFRLDHIQVLGRCTKQL